MTRSNVQLGGQELKLDADGDTSITVDTDDQIDFKTGGSDRVTIGSDGNVFVGTTSDIAPANGTNLYIEDGTISRLGFSKTGSNARKFSIGNGGTYLNIYDETLDAEVFKIDANGQITTPKQPGWFATANDNTVLANGGFTQPLLKNELWDNNSDYDAASSGTHRFTAPVAGKYLVTAGIGIVSNGLTSSRLLISIWKNDYLHQYVGSNYSAGAQPYTTNGSTLVDLSANDYLRMLIQVDGGNKNTDFRTDQQYLATFFGGYLLG